MRPRLAAGVLVRGHRTASHSDARVRVAEEECPRYPNNGPTPGRIGRRSQTLEAYQRLGVARASPSSIPPNRGRRRLGLRLPAARRIRRTVTRDSSTPSRRRAARPGGSRWRRRTAAGELDHSAPERIGGSAWRGPAAATVDEAHRALGEEARLEPPDLAARQAEQGGRLLEPKLAERSAGWACVRAARSRAVIVIVSLMPGDWQSH